MRAPEAPLLVGTLCKCWQTYFLRIKCVTAYSPDLPLWALPLLAVIGNTAHKHRWTEASITTLGQLFDTDGPLAFEDLQLQYDLTAGQFLTHAAVFNVVRTVLGPLDVGPFTCMTFPTLLTWRS